MQAQTAGCGACAQHVAARWLPVEPWPAQRRGVTRCSCRCTCLAGGVAWPGAVLSVSRPGLNLLLHLPGGAHPLPGWPRGSEGRECRCGCCSTRSAAAVTRLGCAARMTLSSTSCPAGWRSGCHLAACGAFDAINDAEGGCNGLHSSGRSCLGAALRVSAAVSPSLCFAVRRYHTTPDPHACRSECTCAVAAAAAGRPQARAGRPQQAALLKRSLTRLLGGVCGGCEWLPGSRIPQCTLAVGHRRRPRRQQGHAGDGVGVQAGHHAGVHASHAKAAHACMHATLRGAHRGPSQARRASGTAQLTAGAAAGLLRSWRRSCGRTPSLAVPSVACLCSRKRPSSIVALPRVSRSLTRCRREPVCTRGILAP